MQVTTIAVGFSKVSIKSEVNVYSRTSTNAATSPQRLLFCPGGHFAYIDSCLNLSTTAKAIKEGRHCQNDLSKKAIVFHLTDGKVKNGCEICSLWRVDD